MSVEAIRGHTNFILTAPPLSSTTGGFLIALGLRIGGFLVLTGFFQW